MVSVESIHLILIRIKLILGLFRIVLFIRFGFNFLLVLLNPPKTSINFYYLSNSLIFVFGGEGTDIKLIYIILILLARIIPLVMDKIILKLF